MKKFLSLFMFFAIPLYADTKIFDEQDLLRAHKIGSAPSSVYLKFRTEGEKDLRSVFLVDLDNGNKLSAADVSRTASSAKFDRVPEGFWKVSTVPAGKYILVQIEVN